MYHLSHQISLRSHRLMVVALVFALISLLVNAGGPAAPNAEAAKDASVSITADNQNVNAGDTVKLQIKLHNVTNATLNGVALKDGKDKVDQKVRVCATTTYTVEATPKNGGPKISQALTINATGTTTNKDCSSPAAVPMTVPMTTTNPLPDLAVTALTVSQSYDPKQPYLELVRVDYTIANLGQAPAENVTWLIRANGLPFNGFDNVTLKAGETMTRDAVDRVTDEQGSMHLVTYSVMVDPLNKIVESDESNNVKWADINVVPGSNPVSTIALSTDKVNKGSNLDRLKLIKP
jgi:hypothetical protein